LPPVVSNSAARQLASSKSASAMASVAVTAASAAAALVPFEMSVGCLPEASQHAVAFRWEEWILKLGILAQRPAPRLASRL
jgi:hypothetical protein